MEKEIEIRPHDNLDSIVYTLLADKARGEQSYCVFNGHVLHSDTVSMDSAYIEVLGCTKEEYEQRMKKWHENENKKNQDSEIKRQAYLQKIEASRTLDNKPITLQKVINGLKFIAEHQSFTQEKLIDELLQLGCNFSEEDVLKQFPQDVNIFEGIKEGDIGCGAIIIANARDNELGRAYCTEKFLSVDDEFSIYNFIRVTTGDNTYTKEIVDALNNNVMHR